MLDVWTWEPNANSGKPLLVLKEKGVPFQFHYVNMGALEQHSAEYLAVNPQGTIPCVIHDGFKMLESTPMMEYVDAAFDGPSLVPHDPYQQWRMRWWMRYVDEYLNPSLAMQAGASVGGRFAANMSEAEKDAAVARIPLPERRRVWRLILDRGVSETELEESRRRVAVAIAAFEAALGEHPYLAGPTYSLADVDAMTTLHSWPANRPEIAEDKTPNLWAWFRRCHDRTGIREAFKLGRFIGPNMGQVRETLGLEPAA